MKNKYLLLLLVFPMLLAFQCDEDDDSGSIIRNAFKVSVAPTQSNFNLNDTVWVYGRVSPMVFDTQINDSIFSNWDVYNTLQIYKLGISEDGESNCFDAKDHFEIIYEKGNSISTTGCENAILNMKTDLNEEETQLEYLIGLRPLQGGDFVFLWNYVIITNTERNEIIIEDYLLPNHPGQIAFNRCGEVTLRFLDQSNKEYYFKVE